MVLKLLLPTLAPQLKCCCLLRTSLLTVLRVLYAIVLLDDNIPNCKLLFSMVQACPFQLCCNTTVHHRVLSVALDDQILLGVRQAGLMRIRWGGSTKPMLTRALNGPMAPLFPLMWGLKTSLYLLWSSWNFSLMSCRSEYSRSRRTLELCLLKQ